MANENTFGGTVKLEGETEYKKALSDISLKLGLVSTELKKTSSDFLGNEKSIESLTAKDVVLNKQLDLNTEKVKLLKGALEQATEQYGENDAKTIKWQKSLFDAETTLNKTKNEIDKNKKSMEELEKSSDDTSDAVDDFADSEDDASKSTIKLGDLIKANLLSDAIVGGVKALGGAMKQVGSAVGDVIKESLGNYAEYEQLAGGVETLFKDSADTVKKYADNAYKTSGLSALDYMETVTSFSASLLQSLGGNTEKSAKIADMAIIDMSDNANKMGTSMDSIQNAYQGFAKQNYTMLDNLKLGYGGTKSEMERLLKDAQKLSGVKYNISNLSDVYEAIHVVQTELGITGTTAKEASETISGSVAAMKSSWQNLLTGLGNGSADDMLISNFVDSALVAFDNLSVAIEQIIYGLLDAVPKLLNGLISKLPMLLSVGVSMIKSLLDGIKSLIPTLIPIANEIITTLLTTIIEMLPSLIEGGIEMIVGLGKGLTESLPTLIPIMIEAILTMIDTLLDNIDLIVDTGIELLLALVDGIVEAIPTLVDKIPMIIEKLISAVVTNLPKILNAGVTILLELAKGLIKAIPTLVSKVPEIIAALVKGFGDLVSNMWDVGKNLVSGIWEGIKGAKDWLLNKIKEWAGGVFTGIKSFFGINSPSRLMRDEVGKYLAQGLGIGFENEMPKVISNMENSLPETLDSSVNARIKTNVDSVELPTANDLMVDFNAATSNLYSTVYSAVYNAMKLFRGDVELDREKVGSFVLRTVEEVVY